MQELNSLKHSNIIPRYWGHFKIIHFLFSHQTVRLHTFYIRNNIRFSIHFLWKYVKYGSTLISGRGNVAKFVVTRIVRVARACLTVCLLCISAFCVVWPSYGVAHSPYGRAAYANVNGLDVAVSPAAGAASMYNEDDEHQQHEYLSSGGHSPTRRVAPPPPSRSETYQPRPPPPVPAEAMASLNIGLDKSGPLF